MDKWGQVIDCWQPFTERIHMVTAATLTAAYLKACLLVDSPERKVSTCPHKDCGNRENWKGIDLTVYAYGEDMEDGEDIDVDYDSHSLDIDAYDIVCCGACERPVWFRWENFLTDDGIKAFTAFEAQQTGSTRSVALIALSLFNPVSQYLSLLPVRFDSATMTTIVHEDLSSLEPR
jgi:hypothetical protein